MFISCGLVRFHGSIQTVYYSTYVISYILVFLRAAYFKAAGIVPFRFFDAFPKNIKPVWRPALILSAVTGDFGRVLSMRPFFKDSEC